MLRWEIRKRRIWWITIFMSLLIDNANDVIEDVKQNPDSDFERGATCILWSSWCNPECSWYIWVWFKRVWSWRWSYENAVYKEWRVKMKINEFDKVLLKDGRTASVVEIFGDGEAYLVDVDLPDNEWDTIDVKPEDIVQVI